MPRQSLRLITACGAEIGNHLSALAQLRIQVFREWPYLYEGQLDYETQYLQTYLQCNNSIAVLCYRGRELIGASTALPLLFAEREMQKPFVDAGLALADYLYYGESLILKGERGAGLGGQFFDLRERHAHTLNLKRCCFCAVERSDGDPRRPANARSNETLWRRRGYRPSHLVCHFPWPDIGDIKATEKPMRFWLRDLV